MATVKLPTYWQTVKILYTIHMKYDQRHTSPIQPGQYSFNN